MKFLTALLSFLIISLTGMAQKATVEGKVTDAKTGLPLASVSVIVRSNSTGVATNVDGHYVITVDSGKKLTLIFSYNGVTKEVEDITAVENKVTTQNIELEQRAKTNEAVIIRSVSNARKETAASLITFQKNTNTVASVISAESIRRSPDRNTGEVLKRIPGASLQEGRFIIVRGLADRYNQAMLNGILLSSTEPDRKTFSFDLIPASMIDNIVVNKAFVPEFPGEWAGGLIQVNTKDIPAKGFLNIQLGTGFNSATVGQKFYKDPQGGKTDWLGLDDGTRGLPASYTTKSEFDVLAATDRKKQTSIGKDFRNAWVATENPYTPNIAFQLNGGFNEKLFGKTIGGNIGITYNKTNRYYELVNRLNKISEGVVSRENDYDDDRYREEVTVGALGSLTMQLNSKNKVSLKSILNINTGNSFTQRNGIDVSRNDSLISGSELSFKQNTFFTVQMSGEHNVVPKVKFKWYGAFNILDGYVPDQRRILYGREQTTDPYRAIIANSLSQQSGSRIYQNLSDYIYTAGGDVNYDFTAFHLKQAVKAGYMLQIKDRLYDAKLFANYLPKNNDSIRLLPADQIFASQNFGDGSPNSSMLAFSSIIGKTFRYLANTILNAGFVQFDNQLSSALRIVWGLRVENYDQLVGSVKSYDPRHTYSKVTDFLPGLNATYKLDQKINLRLSASQTVIRPELRELSFLNLYDFELNASVQGKPTLERTKVSNFDLRYEFYPRAGEVFTVGAFYKHFKKPIEQLFNEGSGGASTFTFQNPEKANSYGVEVEFRKRLDFKPAFKNFTFQANGAYIYSRVKDSTFNVDRPLQGQSPYLINVGIMYDLEKYGFNATVLYNQVGQRIYLVGDISAASGSPDIWEAPRPVLDLQFAKKLWNNKMEIKLNIADIINRTQYFYQNVGGKSSFQRTSDPYRFTRRLGTNYNISFNYSL